MKHHKLTIFTILLGIVGQGFSYTQKIQTQSPEKSTFPMLAASCPKGCSSCWDQCTKSEDCGSGHKCVSGSCGNRCVADTTS